MSHNKINRNKRGYIALTSAIIISIIIMAVVFSVTSSSFMGRFEILEATFKETSDALSESCVETARLRLAEDINYVGNETITIGSDTCLILPIESGAGQKIIKTKAVFQKATTNLKVIINTADSSVVLWEELSIL